MDFLWRFTQWVKNNMPVSRSRYEELRKDLKKTGLAANENLAEVSSLRTQLRSVYERSVRQKRANSQLKADYGEIRNRQREFEDYMINVAVPALANSEINLDCRFRVLNISKGLADRFGYKDPASAPCVGGLCQELIIGGKRMIDEELGRQSVGNKDVVKWKLNYTTRKGKPKTLDVYLDRKRKEAIEALIPPHEREPVWYSVHLDLPSTWRSMVRGILGLKGGESKENILDILGEARPQES